MKTLFSLAYGFIIVVLYCSILTASAATPSRFPTVFPTSSKPTGAPSSVPSYKPSGQPTGQPTSQPSPWSYWFTTNLVESSSLSFGNDVLPSVNQSLVINLEIVMSVETNSTFEIVVSLPRMYKPFVNDYYDGYAETDVLAVTPSNQYEVTWVSLLSSSPLCLLQCSICSVLP